MKLDRDSISSVLQLHISYHANDTFLYHFISNFIEFVDDCLICDIFAKPISRMHHVTSIFMVIFFFKIELIPEFCKFGDRKASSCFFEYYCIKSFEKLSQVFYYHYLYTIKENLYSSRFTDYSKFENLK